MSLFDKYINKVNEGIELSVEPAEEDECPECKGVRSQCECDRDPEDTPEYRADYKANPERYDSLKRKQTSEGVTDVVLGKSKSGKLGAFKKYKKNADKGQDEDGKFKEGETPYEKMKEDEENDLSVMEHYINEMGQRLGPYDQYSRDRLIEKMRENPARYVEIMIDNNYILIDKMIADANEMDEPDDSLVAGEDYPKETPRGPGFDGDIDPEDTPEYRADYEANPERYDSLKNDEVLDDDGRPKMRYDRTRIGFDDEDG